MSKEAQQKGKEAEGRVHELATKLGFKSRIATPTEDFANKTDLVIEETPVQECFKKIN